MSDLIDTLLEEYKSDSEELHEEIKSLKRKLSIDDNKENKSKKTGYYCDVCFKVFKQKWHLTRHVLSHNTFFGCEHCDAKFRRKDCLIKHIKKKHQHGGAVRKTTRPAVQPSDHGYSRHPTSDFSHQHMDHNYVRPSATSDFSHQHMDHNYVRPSATSSDEDPNPRPTSPVIDHALNNNIQDITIRPNQHEQYDLLTFFSNVKQKLHTFLKNRLKNNAVKWYISMQVELENNRQQQSSSPHFRSYTYTCLNLDTFDGEDFDKAFQKMFASFEKYIRESSGWVMKRIIHLKFHTVNYKPLGGSSYIDLPKPLRSSASLLNIRNVDQKCFLWCCIASLHLLDSPLVSDYEPFESDLNIEGLTFPLSINQISKFEKQNPSISVNVFAFEDNDVVPLRITKCSNIIHHIDLLLLQSENNFHYVLIQNLNRFLSSRRKGHNLYHFCRYCLHGFTHEHLLHEHIPYCQIHGEQKIELPSNKNCFEEFKSYEKTMRVPFVIYADFETLNKPLYGPHPHSSTIKTQLLEPCSFAYKVVSTDPNFTKETVFYRGEDAPQKLIEHLLRESQEIEQQMKSIKPLYLSEVEKLAFQQSDKCCLCQKEFTVTDKKARHHDHTSGKYIGAAHINCNLQASQVTFIPVIFHNLKNFDAHLLCQGIGSFKSHRIQCIPSTIEKYISFSIDKLRFIDSFAFLPSSLSVLVDNLTLDGVSAFKHFQSEIVEHTELLLRKGIYPYEYMSSWERFNETRLPPIEQFYSSLTQDTTSQEDYNHGKHVFETFKCKTLGDYHDLYLKTDVLLLADVFENFRDMSQKCYDLDPCHFYASPGLSWQAMLKMTGVTLELMTDIDQVLFIERGIRGGISQISNRYKKANNPYLKDYDPMQPSSYLAYYDVNNLYGHSMSQYLPTGFFTFLSPEEIECFDIMSIPETGSKGYILEVDLHYPQYLHNSHNDYPLAPERKCIPDEKLSPYAQRMLKKLNNKSDNDTLPPRAKVEKLLTTLEDKEHYVVHYRNLQLYLALGMKLKKIHRVLEFYQEPFMKPYVEFNTQMRQQAKSDFEKNFSKLMNNSVFGKTMENLRKHRSVELVHTEKRFRKLTAKSTYKQHRIFSEDLVGVELSRLNVKLNKPIYVGMTVLDLSKRTMYDFYYNHLKTLYDDKVQLQMTDTDSFLFSCETEDLFQDMYEHSHLFDTSDFPKDHFLQSDINKKVMGKMKSETNEKCITEYCGLRSKMYAFSCDDKEDKRAKGIAKVVVKNELSLKHYKDVLFNDSQLISQMNSLRSYDHKIYIEKIDKIGLSCYDDKRFLLNDGVKSLSYGHHKIQRTEFCEFI